MAFNRLRPLEKEQLLTIARSIGGDCYSLRELQFIDKLRPYYHLECECGEELVWYHDSNFILGVNLDHVVKFCQEHSHRPAGVINSFSSISVTEEVGVRKFR